jgi:hypothetical protein
MRACRPDPERKRRGGACHFAGSVVCCAPTRTDSAGGKSTEVPQLPDGQDEEAGKRSLRDDNRRMSELVSEPQGSLGG